ncbi:hypothetical protein SDC9_55770 [bioreactor metagenome]|uniref:Uncharacterized protein n=1 Tax=bioreactor metagenome TaxID=1076179 RepID=A0A644X585_9ZZZZ
MKAVSVSGAFLLTLSLSADVYNRLVYLPRISKLESSVSEFYLLHNEIQSIEDSVTKLILVTGIVGLVLCIFPALKRKNRAALIGILFYLSIVLSGLLQNSGLL